MPETEAYYRNYWTGEREAPPEHDPLEEQRWRQLGKHLRPGCRVLDYGCGGGIFSQKLVEAGCEVVGMDIAVTALELARLRAPEASFLRVRPGERLPVDGFDVVWASDVLEHVYDIKFLMEEFARVLKPDGELIVTVPYHGLLKNLAIVLLRFDRHFDVKGAHVRFFTKRSLVGLAEEAGFAARESVGLGRLPYLWRSLFVRFERRS